MYLPLSLFLVIFSALVFDTTYLCICMYMYDAYSQYMVYLSTCLFTYLHSISKQASQLGVLFGFLSSLLCMFLGLYASLLS